jgi:hypothetical protein
MHIAQQNISWRFRPPNASSHRSIPIPVAFPMPIHMVTFIFPVNLLITPKVLQSAMYMSRPSHGEEHLYPHNHEDTAHRDQTRHGWVLLVPKGREAWICEGDIGGWEKMYECGGDEDASTEVAGEEEQGVRDGETWVPAGEDREGACCEVVVSPDLPRSKQE